MFLRSSEIQFKKQKVISTTKNQRGSLSFLSLFFFLFLFYLMIIISLFRFLPQNSQNIPFPLLSPPRSNYKEGYLQRKAKNLKASVWQRQWFAVKGGFLYCYPTKDTSHPLTYNLLLCSVKVSFEDKVGFEIIEVFFFFFFLAKNA